MHSSHIAIGSMCGIFTDIYQIHHKNKPNLGKYTSPMNPIWDIPTLLASNIHPPTLFMFTFFSPPNVKMPGRRGNDGSESTSANCSGAENREKTFKFLLGCPRKLVNGWQMGYNYNLLIHGILLGGGFKYVLFSPRKLGKMNQFWLIFFKGVETTNQSSSYSRQNKDASQVTQEWCCWTWVSFSFSGRFSGFMFGFLRV